MLTRTGLRQLAEAKVVSASAVEALEQSRDVQRRLRQELEEVMVTGHAQGDNVQREAAELVDCALLEHSAEIAALRTTHASEMARAAAAVEEQTALAASLSRRCQELEAA